MSYKTGSLFWVNCFAFGTFAYGLLSMGLYLNSVYVLSYPINMGIALGSGALALLGLTAHVIADVLRRFEKRLDELERRVRNLPTRR
jgi:hypothetical protein